MNNTTYNEKVAIASLRLAAIQPAYNGTYPDINKKAYYERIADIPLKLPDGSEVKYAPGSYACWESAYRKGGFDALIPKERADKGRLRTLDDDAVSIIFSLREKYPRLTATGIRDKMIADGTIRANDASVATFQRFIKKHNLKGASAPGQKDRKAFEEEFCTGMYQADTLYGPYIKEKGVSRRTYCIMIIDDKSRLIVAGKFFYHDNSINFQKVLKDAISTYGIPTKLYVDNGSVYANEQLSLICGQLGVVLIHTPVRDGAAKGKVERNFRTLRTRFLDALDPADISSIDELNTLLAQYIRNHNTSVHSATGIEPYNRYIQDIHYIKMPKGQEWLDQCFLHRVWRKVRNDATVLIDRCYYDAPMEFIRTRVEVRYIPDDPDSAFIWYESKKYPLILTDKVANSKCKRNNSSTTQYTVNYGGNSKK